MQALCSGLVSSSYVQQGAQELAALSKQAKDLLSRRCLPTTGWPEAAIERLLAVRGRAAASMMHSGMPSISLLSERNRGHCCHEACTMPSSPEFLGMRSHQTCH